MADPSVGLASRNEFFSLAAVNKWLDQNGPQERVGEQRLLPPMIEEQVEPEERERRVLMLKATANEIRKCTKAKVVGRPANWKQVDDEAARMEALTNFAELVT